MGLAVVQQKCSSYNAGQTTAGFTTCILPSAPTNGNLLVAVMQWNSVNGSITTGAGWTLAAHDAVTTNPFNVQSALFFKYAGPSESASQTPGNSGLTYGSTNIWEISGVSGVWATDFVAFAFNDAPAGQPVTSGTYFADGGYATAASNSMVLAFLGGNNSIGYNTPDAMVQVGAGTLVADGHIGATGGVSGVSCVAGHYTLVPASGTTVSGKSKVATTSFWFYAYVELKSAGAGETSTGVLAFGGLSFTAHASDSLIHGVEAFSGIAFAGKLYEIETGIGVLALGGIAYVAAGSDFQIEGVEAFAGISYTGAIYGIETAAGALHFQGISYLGHESRTESGTGVLAFGPFAIHALGFDLPVGVGRSFWTFGA